MLCLCLWAPGHAERPGQGEQQPPGPGVPEAGGPGAAGGDGPAALQAGGNAQRRQAEVPGGVPDGSLHLTTLPFFFFSK